MSVEGNNGQLSAVILLLSAYPDTTTEAVSCATVTLAESLDVGGLDFGILGCGLDLGRDRAQDQVLAQ